MDSGDSNSSTSINGNHANKLIELKTLIDDCIAFAEQWEEPYRPHIFQAALTLMSGSGQASSLPEMPTKEVGPQAQDNSGTPLSKLAQSTGVDLDLLNRVVEIDDEDNIQILGRLDSDSDSVSELQNKYSVVYTFIKEKALGTRAVDIEELRELCRRHGCYNSANFTQYFRKDFRLRENKGEGRAKKYIATRQGLEEAAALIRQMAEE